MRGLQGRARGGGEVFVHRSLIVLSQRIEPNPSALRHFLQRMHALAQCHNQIFRLWTAAWV